jgi:hypothetical protein
VAQMWPKRSVHPETFDVTRPLSTKRIPGPILLSHLTLSPATDPKLLIGSQFGKVSVRAAS